MKIKLLICMMMSSLLLCGCSLIEKETEEETLEPVMIEDVKVISDIKYNKNNNFEPIIYLKEKDEYRPYIVATDDYDGKTLLVRKELLSEEMRISEYIAYYGDSEIDSYLNGEFIDNLPEETKNIIVDSEIEIRSKDSVGEDNYDTEYINRKVFLLSATELGCKEAGVMASEGKPLKYFQAYENCYATPEDSEQKASWWTRSAYFTNVSCVCAVSPKGQVGYTNAFDDNGIRPAFCVEGNLSVKLVDDKFVLDLE